MFNRALMGIKERKLQNTQQIYFIIINFTERTEYSRYRENNKIFPNADQMKILKQIQINTKRDMNALKFGVWFDNKPILY